MVIVNGTREDTEYQECTADLSVLGSNSSCTIKVNQDIGEFKCLKISKNAPDDDENIGDHAMNEDGYIRKERLSITLVSFSFLWPFKGILHKYYVAVKQKACFWPIAREDRELNSRSVRVREGPNYGRFLSYQVNYA